MVKFLQSHDLDFDVCRSFLVVSMVFTHVFEMLYINDYNRNLTYFVTIGFVFLSGLTIGALYHGRIKTDGKRYGQKLLNRSLKLVIIYMVCNLFILIISPGRLVVLSGISLRKILVSICLGTKQEVFGFDILIPMAFTSFFSLGLLKMKNNQVKLAGFLFFVLGVIEYQNVFNFYGVKLLLVGIIGCLIGIILIRYNWNYIIDKLLQYNAIMFCVVFLLVFYGLLCIVNCKQSSMIVSFHLLSTIVILMLVYLVSQNYALRNMRMVKSFVMLISKFMLLAYLFHILFLNTLFVFFHRDSLGLYNTISVGILVLSVTVVVCWLTKITISKSMLFSRLYSIVFKL